MRREDALLWLWGLEEWDVGGRGTNELEFVGGEEFETDYFAGLEGGGGEGEDAGVVGVAEGFDGGGGRPDVSYCGFDDWNSRLSLVSVAFLLEILGLIRDLLTLNVALFIPGKEDHDGDLLMSNLVGIEGFCGVESKNWTRWKVCRQKNF